MKSYLGVIIAFLCLTLSSLAFVSQQTATTNHHHHHHYQVTRAATATLLFSASVLEDTTERHQQREQQIEELRSKLPPLRPNLTALEQEFRNLLEGILYTPEEINGVIVPSPRFKAIFHGIAASYYEPDVYRAFEVLYEDYLPLRLAGRIVYRKLQTIMEESKAYRQEQIDSAILKTGLAFGAVELCWLAFVVLAKEEKTISMTQVKELLEQMEVPASLMKELSILDEDKLEFDGLMNLLKTTEDPLAYLQQLLQAQQQQSSSFDPTTNDKDDFSSSSLTKYERRHELYNQRYTEMLEKFSEWKAFIPPNGGGRRLDILRGCFTGSENPKVVEALRVIYTDYNALRLSGDWIFNVVSTIMNRRLKKQQEPK